MASQPLMRKLWLAMKTFNVPITHPFIQQLTDFDLEFINWSIRFDDPKVLDKYKNTVYDDEFDAWWNSVMNGEDIDDDFGVPGVTGSRRSPSKPSDEETISSDANHAEIAKSGQNNDNPDDWEEDE